MGKKIGVVCLVLAVAISWAGIFGCTRKKPERFEEKLGQMIDKISASLDLTEKQKEVTAVIKKEILKRNEDKKILGPAEMKELEEAFKKQIEGEKFNEAELNKLMDAQVSRREEMRKFMISELAKFHAILTPAQRIKLTEILKELRPGFRRDRKDGAPRGEGPGPRK